MTGLVADFFSPEYGYVTLPVVSYLEWNPVVYDVGTDTSCTVSLHAQRNKLDLLDVRMASTIVPCTRPVVAVFKNEDDAERTFTVHYWEHRPDAADVKASPLVLCDHGLVPVRQLPDYRDDLDGYRFRYCMEVPQ